MAASSTAGEELVDASSKPGEHHGGIMLPWRTLLLGTVALSAFLCLGAAPEAWVFDRAAISRGELWRLITGHWVHSDLAHAIWDITALLLLGALFEARLQWRLPLALLIGSVGVDAWLWWGDPALRYYCGLSGILNSLLIVGLMQLWRDLRHPLILLTGVGAAVKIIVEINAGQALLTQTAWPSVPTVHAAGFLCGLVLGWGIWISGNSLCNRQDNSQKGFSGRNRRLPLCERWNNLTGGTVEIKTRGLP
ncbi:MAG: rhombosortase [Pseudomonadota bacterium]